MFLKYVSDAFTARRLELAAELSDPAGEGYVPSPDRRERFLESRDEYASHNVFWVPARARWEHLQDNAKQPKVGQFVDEAMDLVEHENPSLKGVLPKNYGRADLDKRLLGELVDLIGSIGFTDVDHGSDDVLGKVYEYFLGKFAGQEGRGAGEFCTPRSVVRLLVEMLEPYHGRVYDPCCGSGGMFVQSARFVTAHGGRRDDIAIYGQEFVGATWRLAKMNRALRGLDADLGDRSDDSFHRDLHPDLRADFVLANPPFNKDDWFSAALDNDPRWAYSRPPAGNANFAWVQHFVHHLSPRRGGRVRAGERIPVVEDVRRGWHQAPAGRGGPCGLHRRAAGETVPQHRHPGVPVVRRQGPARQRAPRAAWRGAVPRRAESRVDGDPDAAGAVRRRRGPDRRYVSFLALA